MNEIFWTAKAMERFGKAFEIHLGRAVQFADEDNLAKVKATWPETWAIYTALGERLRSAEAGDLETENYWTATAMQKFGGSFVLRLGAAVLCADATNLALIRVTWPHTWEHYRVLGEQLQQANDEKEA